MNKQEFKERWESNESGGGITFDDIAECAVKWGITRTPRTMQIDLVRYLVLKASGTNDAEEFNPEPNKATELEFLQWFYRAADFGPADGDVRYYLKEDFKNETGKELPEGYDE